MSIRETGQEGGGIVARAARTTHRLERWTRPRSGATHRQPTEPIASPQRGTVPWIARVPDALLNHDPERERPSDFCAGCIE
jgi:hypothetical protein